ncbi:MAG TPA: amine oxidase [Candidatus Pacebacteria bacterium]|nr:amine oxidase [Candidatus Paceibacterota bacterium]
MSAVSNPKLIKYLILGAGPCGLGAAHRLNELGETDWLVLEKQATPGGLASSFVDSQGFVWDVGGHVVHSHYAYFDKVFHSAIGKTALKHQREAWVWLEGRFVPYPFQNNLHRLTKKTQWDCVMGLLKLTYGSLQRRDLKTQNRSFQNWILDRFGSGIAEHFLFPYNRKMWAYPLKKMNSSWVGDRVSAPNIIRWLKNLILAQDDVAWGPNQVFYFPARGGTGALWQTIAAKLPPRKFHYHQTVIGLDIKAQTVTLQSGKVIRYQHLISTLPLTSLLTHTKFPTHRPPALTSPAITKTKKALFSCAVHVVGIGLTGQPRPELITKCWIYYPEPELPFFRVTVFSNYAPANVPHPGKQWSLMCEVSESPLKPKFISQTGQIANSALIAAVIAGLIRAHLITKTDQIVSTWHHTALLGYPTPTLARETVLDGTLKALEAYQIYSRGRFGAWKYEVSNMDHTFMQGVEVVNRLINQTPEVTVWHPQLVNRAHSTSHSQT